MWSGKSGNISETRKDRAKVTMFRDSPKFSGHPYIGRIARSYFRQLSWAFLSYFLVYLSNICAKLRISTVTLFRCGIILTNLVF